MYIYIDIYMSIYMWIECCARERSPPTSARARAQFAVQGVSVWEPAKKKIACGSPQQPCCSPFKGNTLQQAARHQAAARPAAP